MPQNVPSFGLLLGCVLHPIGLLARVACATLRKEKEVVMKDKLVIRLPGHVKDKLAVVARHKGLSLTALVRVYLDERVEKDLRKIAEEQEEKVA